MKIKYFEDNYRNNIFKCILENSHHPSWKQRSDIFENRLLNIFQKSVFLCNFFVSIWMIFLLQKWWVLVDFVSNRLVVIGVLIFHIATNLCFLNQIGVSKRYNFAVHLKNKRSLLASGYYSLGPKSETCVEIVGSKNLGFVWFLCKSGSRTECKCDIGFTRTS